MRASTTAVAAAPATTKGNLRRARTGFGFGGAFSLAGCQTTS